MNDTLIFLDSADGEGLPNQKQMENGEWEGGINVYTTEDGDNIDQFVEFIAYDYDSDYIPDIEKSVKEAKEFYEKRGNKVIVDMENMV